MIPSKTEHILSPVLIDGWQAEKSRNVLTKNSARVELHNKYIKKLQITPNLNRQVVSFQANKDIPFYRWFRYKEGFSTELVSYLINQYQSQSTKKYKILDPFSGIGTTLTTAARYGHKVSGIEILPVGVIATKARIAAYRVSIKRFKNQIKRLSNTLLNRRYSTKYSFPHISITQGAFPRENEAALTNFTHFLTDISDNDVRSLFQFACMTILEDISYTRKDGQYLRWDARAHRKLKTNFKKSIIFDFETAINNKLQIMLEDIECRIGGIDENLIEITHGSCLEELPKIKDRSFNLIITSPPYCNRYDYTRTYALELAYLGHTEEEIKQLRQDLLSCTVENKSKRESLRHSYLDQNKGKIFNQAARAYDNHPALQEVLQLLRNAKNNNELNNNYIYNLVENYFFEMSLVVHEMSRVLSHNGHIIMINDNVQYIGEEIPVDFILSDLAVSAGLNVDKILIPLRGKGNSSQQMSTHGRNETRKCIYIWSTF